MGLLARHFSSLIYRFGGNHSNVVSSTTRLYQPRVARCCKNITTSTTRCCSSTAATTNNTMAPLLTLPLRHISMNNTIDFTLFLRKAKSLLKTNPENATIHVVIGNEAADLDSVVSAVVYAFHLSNLQQPVEQCRHYIPVIAVPKDDICLRTEVIALLAKLELSVDEFVYHDEIDFKTLPISGVTLVDFNNRANHVKEISDKVSRIVDHHEESGDFKDIPKTLKTCGSCATLITEEIHYSKELSPSILKVPPISTLLLSAILVDTFNLDLHSGRTTELDIFMGEILSQHIEEDPDQLFDYLQKAKMNISSMKTYDILRKDYKPVPVHEQSSATIKIGISSATISSTDVISRNDFLEASKSYMSKSHIDVLLVMFLSFDQNSTSPHREIAVVSPASAEHLETVTSYLLSQSALKLREKVSDVTTLGLKGFFRLYEQNPKLSRKFVLPLLNVNSYFLS